MLVRWTPFNEMARLQNHLDSFFGAATSERVNGFTPAVDKSVGAMRADGSTVDIDNESAKLAANALDQQAAVQVAASRIQILKLAIGGGA